MKYLTQFLVGVFIFQLTFGTAVLASDKGDAPSSYEPAKPKTEDILTVEEDTRDFQDAGPQTLPGPSADPYFITNQILEVYDKPANYDMNTRFLEADKTVKSRQYDMASVILPSLPFADFEKNIDIELNPETNSLALVFNQGNRLMAKHVINGISPISYSVSKSATTHDKEILTILDRSGRIYAIDMGYARQKAFKGIIPVFHIADFYRPIAKGEEIHATYVSRGLKPWGSYTVDQNAIVPMDADLDHFDGRALVLYKETPRGRRLLGFYDKKILHNEIVMGEAEFLALLQPFMNASTAGGKVDGTPVMDLMADIMGQLVKSRGDYLKRQDLTADEREALMSMSTSDSIKQLLSRAAFNSKAAQRQVDKFSLTEWRESYNRVHAEAVKQAEEARVQEYKESQIITLNLNKSFRQADVDHVLDWKKLEQDAKKRAEREAQDNSMQGMILRAMSSSAVKTMATFLKVGAVAGAAVLGGHWIAVHYSQLWVVHTTMNMLQHLTPPLWDAEYRRLLPISIASMVLWNPILLVTGGLISNMAGYGFDSFKGLALAEWRMIAVVLKSALERVADMTKQPQFINALKLNMNPLRKVEANSEVGRRLGLTEDVRPAFNLDPKSFISKDKLQNVSDQGAVVLNALHQQETRLREMAWFLALFVVGEDNGIDPATMVMMMQKKDYTPAELEKLMTNPAWREQWRKVAREVQFELKEFNRYGFSDDVKQIPPEVFTSYVNFARETLVKIKNRGPIRNKIAQLKLQYRQITDGMLPYIGNYGSNESQFFSSAVPDDRIVQMFKSGFLVDFNFTLTQQEINGARAQQGDLDKVRSVLYNNHMTGSHDPMPVTDLAATNTNIFNTSSIQMTDTANGAITAPMTSASMGILYQQQGVPAEDSYDPIEAGSLAGKDQVDTYARGMWSLAKSATNLKALGLGNLWIRSLVRKINMVQVLLTMGVAIRVIFGHHPILEFSTYSNAILSYMFMFGWGNWASGWVWDVARRSVQVYEDGINGPATELMQAKTILGQSIKVDNLESMKSGYAALYDLYNESDVKLPPELVKAREEADKILKASPEELAQYKTMMINNGKLQTELVAALSSGDTAHIQKAADLMREAYARGSSFSAGADPNAFKLNALTLLKFSLENPPFATRPNPNVQTTSNLIASPTTTYLGGFVSTMALRPNVNWLSRFEWMIPRSAAIYIGAYLGQKAIDQYSDSTASYLKKKIAGAKQTCKAGLEGLMKATRNP